MFNLFLEPGFKDNHLVSSIADDQITNLLDVSGVEQKFPLPLKVRKRFISLEDFYPVQNILSYEKHMIECFGFDSLLDERQKNDLIRFFGRSLRSELQKNPLINTKEIEKVAKNSLNDALITLPFNETSNAKARDYFHQSADDLFSTFKNNFCDSEQAIRLFIYKRENKHLWESLTKDAQGNAVTLKMVNQIYLNIASIRYTCSICQRTYFHDLKYT